MRKTRDPIAGLREKLLDSGLADVDDIKVLFQTAELAKQRISFYTKIWFINRVDNVN